MQINPYLFFDGCCEKAFRYYEACLGGTVTAMITHAGTPAAEHAPEDWQDKILHARMTVGDWVLMGSDCPPEQYEPAKGFYVSLGVAEPEEAERVFKALARDGTVTMPLEETFWAQRFGMLVDGFGIPWMVNCERPA